MEKNRYLVSVYGSLRRGLGNHRLLENSGVNEIGEFVTEPKYTLFSLGGFPGIHENGTTAVKMEVYEVDDDTFKRLDRLEGYDPDNEEYSMYLRRIINTPFGDAYYYVYNGSARGSIEHGDWKKFLGHEEVVN